MVTKSLGERVFDAVFSCFKHVNWHIDNWNGGRGAERLEQGILVGVRRDDTADIIWVGYANSREFKTQFRVEAHLETLLGTTKYGDETQIMTIKHCLPTCSRIDLRDRVKIRSASGEKILRLCKAFGSIELDLGLSGDIFFKARSLEELMLKVDLLGEGASDEEGKED